MPKIPPHMMKPTTGAAGPSIPAGAMEAPLRALADVFEGAGDISNAFLETAERHNNLANERDQMRVAGMIRQRQAEINEAIMRSEADPGSWLGIYEKGMTALEADLQKQELSPMVRDRMGLKFQEARDMGKIRVSRDALQANLNNTRTTWKYEFDRATDLGHWDDAAALLSEGRGLFDDGYLKRKEDALKHSQTFWQVKGDIDLDPDTAIKRLQSGDFYPDLPLADAERLEREAVREKVTKEKDALEKIQQMVDNGQLPTRDDLEAAMEAERFFPKDVIPEVLKNYDDGTAIDFETKYGLSDGLNAIHKMYKDGELDMDQYRIAHAQYGHSIMAFGNRPGASQLRQRWYSLDPSTWSDGKSLQETGSKALTRRMEQETSKYETLGFFGHMDAADDAKPHERKAQRDAIANRRAAVERHMEEWIKDNPDATTEQMLEYFQTKGSVHGATKTMLRKASGTRQSRLDRLDAIAPTGSYPPSEGVIPAPLTGEEGVSADGGEGVLPAKKTTAISNLPARRGRVVNGKAVGKASTYWDTPDDDNGMTSVGISRRNAPWWKSKKLPTIALAPETAKAMGLSLPKRQKRNAWDISNSMVEVTLPDGRVAKAVYAENGMYIHKNSLNKLIDLSEQFQQLYHIPRGATLDNVKVRPL